MLPFLLEAIGGMVSKVIMFTLDGCEPVLHEDENKISQAFLSSRYRSFNAAMVLKPEMLYKSLKDLNVFQA